MSGTLGQTSTLPDLPVVPWLRFEPDNVGHDGLAAQDGGSAEGAKLLSETTIHGPDDVDPSHVLELPGYDASAASREVTGAGKQSKVVVDAQTVSAATAETLEGVFTVASEVPTAACRNQRSLLTRQPPNDSS